MSERFPDQPDSHEQIDNPYEIERLLPAHEQQSKAHAETHLPRESKKESIDSILQKIEREGNTAETVKQHLKNEKPKASDLHVGHSVKNHSFKQTLKRTQKKLPAYQRPFSKVVHAPVVDALSEAAEGTIARPSGLLVGGIFSAVGSLGVLIVCRYFGYEYNFMLGMAFFVGGFFIGLTCEAIIKSYKRLRG